MPLAKVHKKYLSPFNKWWLRAKNQKIKINFIKEKLKKIDKASYREGAKYTDPIQKAKKGREIAKIIPEIRWVIEKIIVNTGLWNWRWGDKGEVVIKFSI